MENKIKFSKTALEKLPLPEQGKRSTYYDTATPKLALRITSAGTKTFYIVRRTGREMVWFKLGVFPEMTVELAQKEAAKVLGAFAGESNPAQARRVAKGVPTLSEFFKEYGERHGSKKKSWSDDKQRYRDYLEKSLGNRKIDTITREMIGRILSEMDKTGKSNATINNVRALASGIFSKAIEWSFITANPVKGIKTRKAKKRDRFLQAHELPRFFSALAEEPNTTIRDYFLIALLTGARRANVLQMRWSELNLKESIWRIPTTKNGDPQNVTLSPEAVTILKSREDAKGNSVYVFPGSGEKSGHLVEPKAGWRRLFDRDELEQIKSVLEKAGHPLPELVDPKTNEPIHENLNAALVRTKKAAAELKLDISSLRISDIRIHDLRRTLGSWQAKTGASLAIIGKSLNHKNHATTAIYARLDLDPVRASVERATDAMLDAAGIKKTAAIINIANGRKS